MAITLDDEFEAALEDELRRALVGGHLPPTFRRAFGPRTAAKSLVGETFGDLEARGPILKAVIKDRYRPSLLIQDGVFEAPEGDTWRDLLDQHRQPMLDAIPAVGRINLEGHLSLEWVGTGFLVERDDLLATNRHVAVEFAARQGEGFTWRNIDDGVIRARVDLLAEYQRPAEHLLDIDDILYLADEGEPDLALLRVRGPDRPPPLRIGAPAERNHAVAVIGYPWKEAHGPELEDVLRRIFDTAYDVKRLAPGRVRDLDPSAVRHDCSTLRGNSGSPVLDLESGTVVGVHERPSRFNIAVPVLHLAAAVDRVG